MHQNAFDDRAYSAPPDLLAGLRGRGREWERGMEGRGRRREEGGERRKREDPPISEVRSLR